jgi:hypothetical protein
MTEIKSHFDKLGVVESKKIGRKLGTQQKYKYEYGRNKTHVRSRKSL